MARLQVINRTDTGIRTLYPSIFQISSGEAALLCVFAEIVRQADNNQVDIKLEDITGIVLIDEVDKHLHIKMQKEVLPQLFQLFPNVQFIVSSHSPFLSMGLAQTCPERSRLINIDQGGLSQEPSKNPLYEEVYDMMIAENE
jgi:predicted ATP-binding protein involved in virulence